MLSLSRAFIGLLHYFNSLPAHVLSNDARLLVRIVHVFTGLLLCVTCLLVGKAYAELQRDHELRKAATTDSELGLVQNQVHFKFLSYYIPIYMPCFNFSSFWHVLTLYIGAHSRLAWCLRWIMLEGLYMDWVLKGWCQRFNHGVCICFEVASFSNYTHYQWHAVSDEPTAIFKFICMLARVMYIRYLHLYSSILMSTLTNL